MAILRAAPHAPSRSLVRCADGLGTLNRTDRPHSAPGPTLRRIGGCRDGRQCLAGFDPAVEDRDGRCDTGGGGNENDDEWHGHDGGLRWMLLLVSPVIGGSRDTWPREPD
ncbi:hypothetical protein THIOKS12550019 [Thiocapsa sp. KS1]|nr:hypothetical protein THIOKS12550019 [Thiocapsa sp. KS1]